MKKIFLNLTLLFMTLNGFVLANDEEAQETLSLEFLEFLGSFESEDGKWQDPMLINEMIENEQAKASEIQGEIE